MNNCADLLPTKQLQRNLDMSNNGDTHTSDNHEHAYFFSMFWV